MRIKAYIAGPMSNLPQFNFPAFYEAAAALRRQGFEIVSPAELDDKDDQGAALKSADGDMRGVEKTWGDFLARDVKLIADGGIQGIVFLPNWFKSRGARLEATVGLLQKNFQFFDYVQGCAVPLSALAVAWELYAANVHEILPAAQLKEAA